jgi:Pyridoxal-dependent decarboxylase conserved domain
MSSPASTELEVITLDWLGKMIDLPKEFLACSGGQGGGVIQVRKKIENITNKHFIVEFNVEI